MAVGQMIPLGTKEYLFKEIDESFAPEVLELFKACKEYFELISGEVPQDTDDFFKEIPPNKDFDDKHLIGVFDGDKIIAAIDLVEDYPRDKEWIIGLLVIHPDYRRLGLGRKIEEVIAAIVRENRGKFLRIGVQEQNTAGLEFWKSLGYQEKSVVEGMLIGKLESRVFVMNRKLNEK